MVLHRVTARPEVDLDFAAIRAELEIPGPFPNEVLEAARGAAPAGSGRRRDATDLELFTVDPPGSRDLDQAVAIEERPGGWRVFYAIADVGAWVAPGDPIDREAWLRTQTHYCPDHRSPLHPPLLGEGSASLLPDGDRPAVLWTIDVDDDGTTHRVQVERATVRSRAQLTYAGLQDALDRGRAPASLARFPQVGAALLADARERNAIDLGLPEQQVVPDGNGSWTITLRADLPVEEWNAQISLLTGRAAAAMMMEAGVGLLRTLPSADPALFPRLRDAARNLDVEWHDGDHPGDVLARLDTSRPRHAAFADLAADLLRGAGYTAFDGSPPDDPGHAGIGGPYAHVTAPLRRLADRHATEACLAIGDGRRPDDETLEALVRLPDAMRAGDRRAKHLDRSVIDATEAYVLSERVGHVFEAAVIETGQKRGTVVIDRPAVRGPCDTRDLPLGVHIHVRCTEADVDERQVRFERVS